MYLLLPVTTLLLATSVSATATSRYGCRKPDCISYCPDGTPYDCCVVYIRDPCAPYPHTSPSPFSTASLPPRPGETPIPLPIHSAPPKRSLSLSITPSSLPKPTTTPSPSRLPPIVIDPLPTPIRPPHPKWCTGYDDFECTCWCPDYKTKYLCNVEYFMDPCSLLPVATVEPVS